MTTHDPKVHCRFSVPPEQQSLLTLQAPPLGAHVVCAAAADELVELTTVVSVVPVEDGEVEAELVALEAVVAELETLELVEVGAAEELERVDVERVELERVVEELGVVELA